MLKPDSCRGCPLYNISQSFSVPDGKGTLPVYLIGDKLEHEDAIDGKPFTRRGRGGSLLNQALERLGYTRSQFRLGNVVSCQPPGNRLENTSYETQAIQHCRQHFERVLSAGMGESPNRTQGVILAMGNVALKALTGASGSHKEKQSINFLRGFVMQGPYGLVVPTFHPGFIRGGYMKYFGVFMRDLQRAVDVAQGRFYHRYGANYTQPKFDTSPSLHDAICFALKVKDNSQQTLGYDIETPHSSNKDVGEKTMAMETETSVSVGGDGDDVEFSYNPSALETVDINQTEVESGEDEESDTGTILTCQFSLSETSGICFPWEGKYIDVAKKIFSYSNPKMGWNCWGFDDPRLFRHGVIMGSPTIDLMWKWHHCQPDLERNLQFAASYAGWAFPWKHLYGKAMQWYGCADVASLHCIDRVITNEMERMGIEGGWRRHVQDLHHRILDPMVKRGYPVDRVERERVGVWLKKTQERILEEVQRLVPMESGVRSVGPKRKVEGM